METQGYAYMYIYMTIHLILLFQQIINFYIRECVYMYVCIYVLCSCSVRIYE